MEIKSRFDHFNINVTDLDRSIAFYDRPSGCGKRAAKRPPRRVQAGLSGRRTKPLPPGAYLAARPRHRAPRAGREREPPLHARGGHYEAVREHHRAMGCVCYENHDMGLYFINDPDDYWIEILPLK